MKEKEIQKLFKLACCHFIEVIKDKLKYMIKPTVIWNITNKCPYNCSFCCVSANEIIPTLSLKEKLKIVDNLDSSLIRFDISGGDPFIEEDTPIVLEKLSKKYGKEDISVTTTGIGLQKIDLGYLKDNISDLGITL